MLSSKSSTEQVLSLLNGIETEQKYEIKIELLREAWKLTRDNNSPGCYPQDFSGRMLEIALKDSHWHVRDVAADTFLSVIQQCNLDLHIFFGRCLTLALDKDNKSNYKIAARSMLKKLAERNISLVTSQVLDDLTFKARFQGKDVDTHSALLVFDDLLQCNSGSALTSTSVSELSSLITSDEEAIRNVAASCLASALGYRRDLAREVYIERLKDFAAKTNNLHLKDVIMKKIKIIFPPPSTTENVH